ncbi:MAG: chromosomal replication initiator protein DnaA [Deltaproteobacteria bacterium]
MHEHPAGSWERLQTALKARLNPQAYATWISRMTCIRDDGVQLILGLPDVFGVDWVNNHYRHVLEEELGKITPEVRLEISVKPNGAPEPATYDATPPPEPKTPKKAPPKPEPKAKPTRAPDETPSGARIPMNARYTFESFVTGPSNQLAAAAAQSVADNPGHAYNPLFVFGRVGLGKTHLIQAIGHRVRKKNPAARVVYQSTEQFVNEVIQGIRFERMDEVRATYRACDCLIIDDIQFIAGKEACQAEFFHTFNALYDARKQVVLTSDKLPHEIKDLEERVRTRFQWGLIVDLQPPELETRVAIVKKKGETDGIDLDDEVAMFIAQSVRSNVRELEGCLIRVSAYAQLTNQPISIDLAKEVLKDVLPGKSQLTCETIVKTVSSHFDVKVSDLKSQKRGRAIALPRQISMYLCRKHTGSSYPEIGNALGGKDHTTALNAFNRITQRMSEPDIKRHVEAIERALLD